MSIVDEIRQDREKGAKRLESEYKAGLMTLARRFCTDESDANELVNRTFAIVVANIDSYLEQSAFFGWMSRILANCHSKDVRRKSNEMVVPDSVLPEDAEDEDAYARVFREVDASLLRDAIEQLPPDVKRTLMMHYFMDMPIKDVAKVLSAPSGTILWRLHYARQILAAKLGASGKKSIVVLLAIGLFIAASAAAVAIGVAVSSEGTKATSGAEATFEASNSVLHLAAVPFASLAPLSAKSNGERSRPNESAAATASTASLPAAVSALTYNPLTPCLNAETTDFWDTTGYDVTPASSESGVCSTAINRLVCTEAVSCNVVSSFRRIRFRGICISFR